MDAFAIAISSAPFDLEISVLFSESPHCQLQEDCSRGALPAQLGDSSEQRDSGAFIVMSRRAEHICEMVSPRKDVHYPHR